MGRYRCQPPLNVRSWSETPLGISIALQWRQLLPKSHFQGCRECAALNSHLRAPGLDWEPRADPDARSESPFTGNAA